MYDDDTGAAFDISPKEKGAAKGIQENIRKTFMKKTEKERQKSHIYHEGWNTGCIKKWQKVRNQIEKRWKLEQER